jgi:tetrahydromethanopterin S-methyltransferase subunit E
MLFGAVTAVNIWIAVFSDVTAEWSGRWLPVCVGVIWCLVLAGYKMDDCVFRL